MSHVAIEAAPPALAPVRHPSTDAIVRASLQAPALVQYRAAAWSPSAAWNPASSARIRSVETAVGIGIMAYFAYGGAAAMGLF